ncbi:MAG: flagellar motor switch protein FliM [Pirellulaceae bacterium]|nr:flagellar motor switch protein FliM [Pirellulaceae bacterium]
MSDEVLSQAEVESLLNAMEVTTAVPSGTDTGGAAQTSRVKEKITPYDFKRPERVGKEQMRALQSLHEGFGRNFSVAISALLRSIVEVKLTSVDQLTYSEFVFSLENPTCFNLLKVEPLDGKLILDINPGVLYPIINRLLGGGTENTPPARRPLTEIELRLVTKVTDLFLKEMKDAWKGVVDLEPTVERVESNPQLVQIVPPNEVIILVSFELTIGEIRGMMNLCIPYNSIERIGSKLQANSWTNYGRTEDTVESKGQIGKQLEKSIVEVVVTLAESSITTSDLLSLRVGDIITTEKDIHAPLTVNVQGCAKYHGTAGAFKNRKAVQIDKMIAAEEEPPSQESVGNVVDQAG